MLKNRKDFWQKDYQLFLATLVAEANENAFKLASFYNGRKKIVAFKKSFHGRTSLAVAATDNLNIIAPVNENENIIFLPFNDEAALETCFKEIGNEISSVIIEGIQGVGGINEATNSFLQKISSLCKKHNAVFIADSVQCGYGRSGKFSRMIMQPLRRTFIQWQKDGQWFPGCRNYYCAAFKTKAWNAWYNFGGKSFGVCRGTCCA